QMQSDGDLSSHLRCGIAYQVCYQFFKSEPRLAREPDAHDAYIRILIAQGCLYVLPLLSGNLTEQPQCAGPRDRLAFSIQIQQFFFRFFPAVMEVIPCEVSYCLVRTAKGCDGRLHRSYFCFSKLVFTSVWRDPENTSLF